MCFNFLIKPCDMKLLFTITIWRKYFAFIKYVNNLTIVSYVLKDFVCSIQYYLQILDLSRNRLREITSHDLERYSGLSILYLTDNIITEISDDSLEDKSYLHTLDISVNPFHKIPSVLFHLPALKSLRMGRIRSEHIVSDIEDAKPITSPLTYLDLSHNKLNRLPDLGLLPTLLYYNVTGNMHVKMNITHFAGLCNLEQFINQGFTADFEDPCECWRTEMWLKERKVNFTSFQCGVQGMNIVLHFGCI